jgi:hypothetical protein
MGTNYYAKINVCKVCKHEDKIHLGKSSCGWSILLQFNFGEYYKTWPEMKKWLKGKPIYDEYGGEVSYKDFVRMVESRKNIPDPERVDYGDRFRIVDGYKFFDCDFS